MAIVISSSAIYNASTQKYLIILENAVLIKNDPGNKQLTIELGRNNVMPSTPTFKPQTPSSSHYTYDIKSTLIIQKPTMDNKIVINDKKCTDEYETFTSMKIQINKKHQQLSSVSISQSGTSPINENNPRILTYDALPRRLSLYLMSIKDPIHKTNLIRRMLRCTHLTQNDIALTLPSKYEEKYQVIKKINAGLQASIHCVKCIQNNKKYAMKSIKYKTIYQLRQHLQRYLIVHQHKFMHYEDIFVDVKDKTLHIIQPLFKETITERLCRLKGRKFSKMEIKSVILQLMQKIDCLHSVGYVHHDLKPSNIMFDEIGQLHIIDFDLMERNDTKIAIKGTVGFIAPELFLSVLDKTGKRKISSKTSMDIWSIGSIVCYVAFKGNIPFNNIMDNNERINNLRQYMDIHSFLEESHYRDNKWSFIVDVKIDYCEDYNPNLFQLISDLLAFKPNDRPNAATVLAADQYSWFNQQL